MLEVNKVYNEDCLETMKKMSDGFVDLTVTSPPYDNLRDYKGYSFDFEGIARELFRTTKQGGVVVWVVGDAVLDGSESGSSFRQALFFKEVGFNLHDTMIYQKDSSPFPESNRYNQSFEYMFVLTREKPKTFNPIRVPTKGYPTSDTSTQRNKDGVRVLQKYERGFEDKTKENIWKYVVGFMKSTTDRYAFDHPATFPERLVEDHIKSWSNEGDLVFDPFMGSGTTAKMARLLNRNYIGSEISKEYCEIIKKRLAQQTLL